MDHSLGTEAKTAGLLDAAFWITLGRGADPAERRSARETLTGESGFSNLVRGLLSSTEFRVRYEAWDDDLGAWRRERDLRDFLARIGPDAEFVGLCYQVLFDRHADAGGLEFYRAHLLSGLERIELVRVLVMSDEFKARYAVICPGAGRVPRDTQLCELANPAKWDNPDWVGLLRSLRVLPVDRSSMHRKSFEYVQTLYGLQRLGRLTPQARVVSVGAGHECLLYWLANHVGEVVATDQYDAHWDASAGREGDAVVLQDPAQYAPFPYREDHLRFERMDGRHLEFSDATFDVAYSLSAIEHFGGVSGARQAVAEMARVLRPGGICVLATEWHLGGSPGVEVFSADEVRAILDVPGLRLVQPIDDRVWQRYEGEVVDLEHNALETPHMVVRKAGTIFTSVVAFLERTTGQEPVHATRAHSLGQGLVDE